MQQEGGMPNLQLQRMDSSDSINDEEKYKQHAK